MSARALLVLELVFNEATLVVTKLRAVWIVVMVEPRVLMDDWRLDSADVARDRSDVTEELTCNNNQSMVGNTKEIDPKGWFQKKKKSMWYSLILAAILAAKYTHESQGHFSIPW